jgi:predicted DNA-binding protein|tara:strand:- start:220 stop:459 length:240 start_codon:yes stop_codon:yes gene_type:complete
MTEISANLPDTLGASLESVAAQLRHPKSEVVRQAIESYLEDSEDLTQAREVLQDDSDPALDWEGVKRDLLDSYRREVYR